MSKAIAVELNKDSSYSMRQTAWGTWFEQILDEKEAAKPGSFKRQIQNRSLHREFVSHRTLFGQPLINISQGKDPATGRRAVAKGILAIGGCAAGVISIGQFATGYVSIGQFSAGRILSIGQFSIAPINIGQFAIGGAVIAQAGLAVFGIFQFGAVVTSGIGPAVIKVSDLLRLIFA